jgi:hypothetical protein
MKKLLLAAGTLATCGLLAAREAAAREAPAAEAPLRSARVLVPVLVGAALLALVILMIALT